MKQGWKMVKLGEILSLEKGNQVRIQPDTLYTIAGVQNGGKGVQNKRKVIGSELTMPIYQLVKENQLLWCKVDTRNGAFGITDSEHFGSIVSTNMHLANIRSDVVAVEYLIFLFQHKSFYEVIEAISEGSTNRRYATKDQIFKIEIPLPPLTEQQRIAGRLAALKGKIDEVRRLRGEQEREIVSFRNGLFRQICDTHKMTAVGEFLIPNREVVTMEAERDYKQITVKMQHKGVILRGIVRGSEVGSVQFRAKAGDFIISKIDARNGAMGLVPTELHGAIVTNDFPLFSSSANCLPKYFEFVSNTEYFDQKCIESSEGTTNRVRLKMDRFSNIEIPLPPISEQQRVVEILEKMEQLKAAQAGQLAGLEGLFPAVLERAFRGGGERGNKKSSA